MAETKMRNRVDKLKPKVRRTLFILPFLSSLAASRDPTDLANGFEFLLLGYRSKPNFYVHYRSGRIDINDRSWRMGRTC
jgi:hypothetical protein